MKKKNYLMTLALMCLSAFGYADQWNGTLPNADTTKYPVNDSSKGTQQNPFLIESAADLAQLSANVKAGNAYANKYFKLTTDIDLNNEEWHPIGTASNRFDGNFDGDYHIIKNLKIGTYAFHDGTGLFGKVKATVIRNLRIEKAAINSTNIGNVGALIGSCNNKVINCSVDQVTITIGEGGNALNIGGMIGKCYNNEITNCYATNVTINTINTNRGGLIGQIAGGDNGINSLTNCYAAKVTISSNTASNNWGTLAGKGADGKTYSISFKNCYADGALCGNLPTTTTGIVTTYTNKNNTPVTITAENKSNNEFVKTLAQFKNGEVAYLLDMSQNEDFPCLVSDAHPKVVKAGKAYAATETQLYAKGTAVIEAPTDYTYINCTANYSDITSGQITGITQQTNRLLYLPQNVTSDWENNVVIEGVCANLVLQDGTDFICPTPFNASTAEYTRECYTDGGWETIALPFAWTDIKSGTTSIKENYTIEEYSETTEGSNDTKVIKFATTDQMAAGKAYLIKYKGETGNKQSYVFSGSGTISSSPTDAAFKGTYALIQHAEAKGNYMLNAGGNAFNQIGETDANIPAFRAYLKGEPQQLIHYSIIHEDGNATGIQPLQAKATIYVTGKTLMIQSDQTRTFNIYSIDGQKVRSAVAEEGITAVDGLAQGIYIVDNQKVIIK